MNHIKNGFAWTRNLLLCLLVIGLGEWLPWMPAVQRFQEAHLSMNQALTGITVVMTILGTLLLAFTQFLVHVPNPNGTPQVRINQAEGSAKGPGWFFTGKSISAGFSDQAPIWRVRKAFRSGEWRRVPRWRRMALMMLGAILLFYGLFGLLILLSPPGLKFFLFLAAVYATARSVYAFAFDQPLREQDAGSV